MAAQGQGVATMLATIKERPAERIEADTRAAAQALQALQEQQAGAALASAVDNYIPRQGQGQGTLSAGHSGAADGGGGDGSTSNATSGMPRGAAPAETAAPTTAAEVADHAQDKEEAVASQASKTAASCSAGLIATAAGQEPVPCPSSCAGHAASLRSSLKGGRADIARRASASGGGDGSGGGSAAEGVSQSQLPCVVGEVQERSVGSGSGQEQGSAAAADAAKRVQFAPEVRGTADRTHNPLPDDCSWYCGEALPCLHGWPHRSAVVYYLPCVAFGLGRNS